MKIFTLQSYYTRIDRVLMCLAGVASNLVGLFTALVNKPAPTWELHALYWGMERALARAKAEQEKETVDKCNDQQ